MTSPTATSPRRSIFSAALVALLTLFAACGTSPALQAARRGDLAALRQAMGRERALCKLDRAEVRELAKETAARELTQSATAEKTARIEEARACQGAVSASLGELARGNGDVAAAATLALLEGQPGDKNGDARLRRHGASQNGLWRAVAARAAVGAELGPARRAFYLDADERVRLAALRAAMESSDSADRGALIEAARLDPNPVARALASRALGGLADGEVVLALRDLYGRADEGQRQSIVDAWGRKESANAGGLRELIRVAETERGAPSIEAGWVLLRFAQERDAAPIGTRALLRAIEGGLPRDRVLAIMDAPAADPRVVAALRKAAEGADPEVKIAALTRLVELPATRSEGLRGLALLAKSGSKPALHALARAGDGAAARSVAEELSSPDPEVRLAAGRTLVAAGELDRAADLLADRDAHVRMTAACAILNYRETSTRE